MLHRNGVHGSLLQYVPVRRPFLDGSLADALPEPNGRIARNACMDRRVEVSERSAFLMVHQCYAGYRG